MVFNISSAKAALNCSKCDARYVQHQQHTRTMYLMAIFNLACPGSPCTLFFARSTLTDWLSIEHLSLIHVHTRTRKHAPERTHQHANDNVVGGLHAGKAGSGHCSGLIITLILQSYHRSPCKILPQPTQRGYLPRRCHGPNNLDRPNRGRVCRRHLRRHRGRGFCQRASSNRVARRGVATERARVQRLKGTYEQVRAHADRYEQARVGICG